MILRPHVPIRIRILQVSLIVAVSFISFATLTQPIGLRPTTQAVDVGDVAQVTMQSPRDIEYVSEIRTEEAKKAPQPAIQPVYSLPDPAIARQQIEGLRVILQNITSVRGDVELTIEEKKSKILSLSDVRLKLETVDYLLNISDSRWDVVQAESVRVLEQIMRRAIYEDKVDAAQAGISTFVSLTLNEQQSALVTELVTAFVVPNSFFSQELTIAASQAAREAVKPIVKSYKAGETIVPAGEIILPADMEAFQQLDIVSSGQRWQDMAGAVSIILLFVVFVPLYFIRRKRLAVINDPLSILVIAAVFVTFLIGARLFTDRTLAPYGYPLQAAGLLIATLFGLEVGKI